MNILYLNTTYQCGGAEKVTSQIFQGMKKRGHKVYQIVCYDLKHSSVPANVHVLYPSLPMRIFNRLITGNHGNQSLHIWYSRRRILSFIRKYHIDIVHLNNAHGNFLGIKDIADIADACPMVWTIHDFWAMTGHCASPLGCKDQWKSGCRTCPRLENYPALRKDVSHRLFKAKQQSFKGHGIVFTVPSKWMLEQFQSSHMGNLPCMCVYNSLDIQVWKLMDKHKIRTKHQLDSYGKIIGFIASDPQKKTKGMDYLLEALSCLPNPEDYLLLVAGEQGSALDRLDAKFHIRHLGYLHSQKELNEFYSMADILINPSLYETFGLTNIEAMACGTPVIAFPVCTMPEIIPDSCGWVTSQVDADALSKTIQLAFSDDAVLEKKGKAARERAEKVFSEEKMLDQFEKLYMDKIDM